MVRNDFFNLGLGVKKNNEIIFTTVKSEIMLMIAHDGTNRFFGIMNFDSPVGKNIVMIKSEVCRNFKRN